MKKIKHIFIIIIFIQIFYCIFENSKATSDGNSELEQNKNYTETIESVDKNYTNTIDDVDENNSNLAVLRLSQGGITPVFQKQIKEYYIIISETIQNLNVTAIPENSNSKVEITGNTNLKNGSNTIYIKVTSENKKQTSEYKIYVTKTDDKEAANANLENLAIENATLMPDYQQEITNYKAEVENGIEEINVLAIPQNHKATVKITGNKELKEGENTVEILVYAPNGTTFKKYQIQVYRKTQEESQKQNETENMYEQNQIENEQAQNEFELGFTAERTSTDNSKQIQEGELQEREEETKSGLFFLWGVIVFCVVGGIIGIVFYYFVLRKK